jgi:DNA-damage-inducible protein D
MELDSVHKALDAVKNVSKGGIEYWRGRDIQSVLGYATWENFEGVIKRAKVSCESTGEDSINHFRDTTKMVVVGSGAEVKVRDCFLDRYACYLIAMSGDTSKPEIGIAQAYFAVRTRLSELEDALSDDEKRILLRDRVKDANKYLNMAAKKAGVQNYGLFHDAGYRGLYGLTNADIKRRKGIPKNEDLLDCAGRVELAANEFRITQAEDRLTKQKIQGEKAAAFTHHQVGQEVRNSIKKIGGTMPENLPAEVPIKKLKAARKPKKLTQVKKQLRNPE